MIMMCSSWYCALLVTSVRRPSTEFRSRLCSCIWRHIASFWKRWTAERALVSDKIPHLISLEGSRLIEGRMRGPLLTSSSSFHGMSASTCALAAPLIDVACFFRGGAESSWSWFAGRFLSSILMRSGEGRETTWLWTRGIRTRDRPVNVYLAWSSKPFNTGATSAVE